MIRLHKEQQLIEFADILARYQDDEEQQLIEFADILAKIDMAMNSNSLNLLIF
jgi:hypothetical protein